MNLFYQIFKNLLPYEIYKIDNKPIVLLFDIDHDNVYEIVGLYDDQYNINIRVLKYINNKWCIFKEKKMVD
ncbi:MAG: hypothetical protein K0Q49_1157 [Haloplasmataceae bacterium]|jgi:hypothetical protein|nr:hypothetical protein [Haloplasmataceae bacterium]